VYSPVPIKRIKFLANMTDPHTFITFSISVETHTRMRRLMGQCGINSIEELFTQMVDELDWSVNMASPVKAALLATRAISKAASSSNGSANGNSSRTGEQPD
jgi:hypothetical protein